MAEPVVLSESLGDYLESIYHLVRRNKVARVKEIAERMKVRLPSVSGALKALAERNLIRHDPYSLVTLTRSGEAAAREIVRRHEVLSDFFQKVLGADAETAERNACRVEHAVEPEITERLVSFLQFVESCPRAGLTWTQAFDRFCEHGGDLEECERCLVSSLDTVRRKRAGGRGEGSMDTTLKQIKPGHKCKVVRLGGAGAVRKRIADMGVTTGSVVEVERVAPLGDPIGIKVRGYHLSLRKEEADAITVEPL